MNIAISGSNGYLATNLIRRFQAVNHTIIPINRHELYNRTALSRIISGTDTVIHLAGAPILQKWTDENKEEILRSRTETTQNIVRVINELPSIERPKTFISASAVGIYKPNVSHTESSTLFADDFVGNVVKQWENASEDLDQTIRRIIFRIGIVIGKESGTMQKLIPVFKLGIGGKVSTGKQPFPFVHVDDAVNAFFWATQNKEVNGIFNLAAPQNITNGEFTKALSRKLKRPAIFTVPEAALKMIYGEAASLMVQAPQVHPERLRDYGFRFKYPDIKTSLDEIVK
ncbi:MAG: TIGR01777 family oxidoreductase [Prolixibacteraceae bacterium]|jgi:hypothetical protein